MKNSHEFTKEINIIKDLNKARKTIISDMIERGQLEIIHIEREETKQADTLEALCTLGPIQGYTESEHARKEKFHSLARRALRNLANELGYTARDYDLRINRGGPAVCGETTLHADNFYMQVSQSCFGSGNEIMFRACDSRADYSGKQNHYANIARLDNPQTFARAIRSMARFGFQLPGE